MKTAFPSKSNPTNSLQCIPKHEVLFEPFKSILNDFYNDFFGLDQNYLLSKTKSAFDFPKVNIYIKDDVVTMEAAVPGLSKEQIDVEVYEDSNVRIRGCIEDVKNADYKYKELSRISFDRTIGIPANADTTKEPLAKFENGILSLSWHVKVEEKPQSKTKKIAIN